MEINVKTRTSLFAAMAAPAFLASAALAQFDLQTIALTGRPIPGYTDVFYGSQMSATISKDGQLLLNSTLSGAVTPRVDDQALLAGFGSSLNVLRTGTTLPGTDATIASLPPWHGRSTIGAGGTVVFSAIVTGPGIAAPANTALVRWSGGAGGDTLEVLAAPGGSPPMPAGGEQWGEIYNVAMNDAGKIAFSAALSYPSGSGGQNMPRAGVWTVEGNVVTQVARSTDPAPGLPGVQWRAPYNGAYSPTVDAAGDVGFAAELYGSGQPMPMQSLWRHGAAGPELLMRGGGHAPSFPDAATFHLPLGANGVVTTDAGESVFTSRVRIPGQTLEFSEALWLSTRDGLAPLIVSGEPAPVPDPGVTFARFLPVPSIASGGQFAFIANLSGPGINESNSEAAVAGSPGAWRVLARQRAQVPGMPEGVLFDQLRHYGSLIAVNSSGDVVLGTGLTGPGTNTSNDQALFVAAAGEDLQLLVREGEPFQVDAFDSRIVESFDYFGSLSGEGGHSAGLNPQRQFVFSIRFTDGTSGVFLAQIPEPSAAALLGICLISAGLPRRRRRHG